MNERYGGTLRCKSEHAIFFFLRNKHSRVSVMFQWSVLSPISFHIMNRRRSCVALVPSAGEKITQSSSGPG